MFKFKSQREQLLDAQRQNAFLQSEILKQEAEIEYVAMMCDVELEMPAEEVNDEQI